jgi:hypothetical protein
MEAAWVPPPTPVVPVNVVGLQEPGITPTGCNEGPAPGVKARATPTNPVPVLLVKFRISRSV